MFERLRKAYWRVKLNWILSREGYCTKHYIPLQTGYDGTDIYCLECRKDVAHDSNRYALERQKKLEEAAKLLKELRSE